MKRAIIILLSTGISILMNGQPYIDVLNVRYIKSPAAGFVSDKSRNTSLQNINLSINLPIQLKNKRDAVIISPYYEQWGFNINDSTFSTHGIVLPIGFLKEFNKKWAVTAIFINRINAEKISFDKNNTQIGGAVIFSYTRSSSLKYKFGTYINKDLFGWFIMPLAGIDWKMSKPDHLFGVLPGSLIYQHKTSASFYYGFSFRAITNSYRLLNNNYLRLDENQLALFADYYISPKLVLNAESGHSVLRRVGVGNRDMSPAFKLRVPYNNGLFFKLSFAYRISL